MFSHSIIINIFWYYFLVYGNIYLWMLACLPALSEAVKKKSNNLCPSETRSRKKVNHMVSNQYCFNGMWNSSLRISAILNWFRSSSSVTEILTFLSFLLSALLCWSPAEFNIAIKQHTSTLPQQLFFTSSVHRKKHKNGFWRMLNSTLSAKLENAGKTKCKNIWWFVKDKS